VQAEIVLGGQQGVGGVELADLDARPIGVFVRIEEDIGPVVFVVAGRVSDLLLHAWGNLESKCILPRTAIGLQLEDVWPDAVFKLE
jgi:hypothetical protein